MNTTKVIYNQEEAEKTGLSFNAITKIEQGLAKHPTLKTLIKLADAFEISLDELVGRNNVKHNVK